MISGNFSALYIGIGEVCTEGNDMVFEICFSSIIGDLGNWGGVRLVETELSGIVGGQSWEGALSLASCVTQCFLLLGAWDIFHNDVFKKKN